MICGGRSSRCCGFRPVNHAVNGRDRSDRCKASWKPLSENSSGFGPSRIRWDQCQERFEHISQRGFTRQHDREVDELDWRLRGFDLLCLGRGLGILKACKLHDFGGIDAMLRQNGCDTASEIQWKVRLLIPPFPLVKLV